MQSTHLAASAVALLAAVAVTAPAATRTVGPGRQYETISAAVSTAESGDTILVHDGIYKESITIGTRDLTLMSANEWGAVLDGDSGRLAVAFLVQTQAVKIVGFKFRNYRAGDPGGGIVKLQSRAANSEVKYNYFTGNVLENHECANIFLYGASHSVVRGNVFAGNTITGGSAASLVGNYAKHITVELNKFYDVPASGKRSIYWSNMSNNLLLRCNHIKAYLRLRRGKLFHVEHNIFDNLVNGSFLFNDQNNLYDPSPCGIPRCEDYDLVTGVVEKAEESHVLDHNTFYLGWSSEEHSSVDNVRISNNLFIGPHKAPYLIYNRWGGEGTITKTTIIDNQKHNTAAGWHDLKPEECTLVSGNVDADPSYDPATGACAGSACNPGADLRIDVWPFTRQDGSALQVDYPYGTQGTPLPPGNLGISERN